MSKIWVTRSQPGAQRSAENLISLGYETLVFPLLTIGPPITPPVVLPEEAILIITSQNALWTMTASTDRRCWPVIAVGEVTAQLAVDLGFENVYCANGTSADIVPLIQSEFPNDIRPFIHISGETVRGNICQALQALSYSARRNVYYASQPVQSLAGIQTEKIDTVLLYSPKAAQTLRALAPDTAHMTAISISAETDEALADLHFSARRIASEPNEVAMFTRLD